jgi:hypothetical protein
MARNEADREDLMAEATAFRRRAELIVAGETDPVVAGVRDNGNWSVYFGPDPVYGFDAESRLRRAFVRGQLYRSQGETLARLRRVRTDETSELQRHDLESHELESFLAEMAARLRSFQAALANRSFQIVKQVPVDGDLVATLVAAIDIAVKTTQLSKPLTKR